MGRISVKNLTFTHTGSHEKVFDNASFFIDTDWKLGLIGRNGKGKTTFLKLLKGVYEYNGSISPSVGYEYFPYDIADKSLSVFDILQQIDPSYEDWKIYRELNLLKFGDADLCRPFGSFSNGEQTKILLAALFSKENSYLLIDEPTNHLDKEGRKAAAAYLNGKKSFILVSHDKGFLDGCIDHVMSINKSDIEINKGNCTTYLENASKIEMREKEEKEKLSADINRLKQSAARISDWADKAEKAKYSGRDTKSGLKPDKGYLGAKAAKIMKRSTVMRERTAAAIEEKTSLLKNAERVDALSICGGNYYRDLLLSADNVTVGYGGAPVNLPISFSVNRGERISLEGKNGSGKTSLLRALIGQLSYGGVVEKNARLIISYVSQDTSALRGSVAGYASQCGIDKTAFITALVKLGVTSPESKVLEQLSEGERKKVLIAASLSKRADLYVWDEPLNFIDIISRGQITDMLLRSSTAMIFVEHDIEFAEKVATRRINVTGV